MNYIDDVGTPPQPLGLETDLGHAFFLCLPI